MLIVFFPLGLCICICICLMRHWVGWLGYRILDVIEDCIAFFCVCSGWNLGRTYWLMWDMNGIAQDGGPLVFDLCGFVISLTSHDFWG
jgi:hypothetical protein